MATEPAKEYPVDVVRGTFFEHDVDISQMFVHFRTEFGGYARPLRQTRVNKLIKEFDRQALGVVLLSMRPDGRMACIDGQHRIEVCKHFGIETIDAFIYIDLTLEDEARLYRKFGDYLKQTALDKYHAAIAERVPEYLVIQRILGDIGLHVPNSLGSASHSVDAVHALVAVSTTYGPDMLKRTLALLHDAWDGEHRAYRSMIILGTAAFMARFHDHKLYTRKRLVQRMSRLGIDQIEIQAMSIKRANMASNGTNGWGHALMLIHDNKIEDEKKLGDWPSRLISEQQAKQAADHIKALGAAMTPEQRRARGQKASDARSPEQKSAIAHKGNKTRFGYTTRTVPCPYCYSEAGKACYSADGNMLKSFHVARQEKAKEWRETSKLTP